MIFLEILNSPDKDFLAPYEFYFKTISIGSSKRSNLYLPFPGIKNYHLKLSLINDNKVAVKNIDAKHYYSNGKKIEGEKLHTVGDILKIGPVELKIIQLNLSIIPVTDYKKLFQEAYERGSQTEFF